MKPRYYQQEAHDAVWQFLNSQKGNPVIVLPTGAGKGPLIGMIVNQAVQFRARVIVLQHRKELIEQNAEKIRIMCPGADIGIFSAGLKSKQIDHDVICAGIQSVYSKAYEFGRRELVIVDECHLIGEDDESMFGRFIKELKSVNPDMSVAGLSATPFRTGEGPICAPNKLFQRICYEANTGVLINEGYLCPLTNQPSKTWIDSSACKIRGGEFLKSDEQEIFSVDPIVMAACEEIVGSCSDRKSILVFCCGVEHAHKVAQTIGRMTGDPVGIVTGETFAMERQQTLTAFKSGRLRWIVNCDVLTTGFDAPRIDAIAILRFIMSPGLFCQMMGRGLRLHESKTDCLLLDFGQNIKRHGAIDDPDYGRAKPQSREAGDKTDEREANSAAKNGRGIACLLCGLDVPVGRTDCPECGAYVPQPEPRHEKSADLDSKVMQRDPPEEWEVIDVKCAAHAKRADPTAPPTLRIDYHVDPVNKTGNLTRTWISEWVCIEHAGYARTKAEAWWKERSPIDVPHYVEDAVDLFNAGSCRRPSTITTTKEGKFYRIKNQVFQEEIPDRDEIRDPRPVRDDFIPSGNGSFVQDYSEYDDIPF